MLTKGNLMSAIDTIEHAHVGNFFGIPIYWFLEEVELRKLTEQSSVDSREKINKLFMSVGGGSGEHSALILNNEALLVKFLNNIKDDANLGELNDVDSQIKDLAEKIQDNYLSQDYLVKGFNIYNWSLDQNQWPLESFIRINEEISKRYTKSDSLQNKIQNAFALFIIYEMPLKHCLKDPQLIEIANLIKTNKWKNIFVDPEILKTCTGFEDVTAKSGKVTRNNKTIWGYSLQDWKRENNSLELSEKLTAELSVKNNHYKIKI